MEIKRKRRKIVFAYLIIILVVVLSSLLSADNNYINLDDVYITTDGWVINGVETLFPYKSDEEFVATKILPDHMDETDYLILRCRYDYATVYIDDEIVFESKDSYYIAHITNAGNKEIAIPLKEEYSNKEVKVVAKLHKSLYQTSFSSAMITTGGAYVYMLMKKNIDVLILSLIFFTTGMLEVIMSLYFIIKRIKARRQISFEAMLFAGLFSVATASWCVNYTRIPAILLGNMVQPSIVGYISFLLMPLTFLEFVRAMDYRNNKILNVIVKTCAIVVLVEFLLNIIGVMDWAQTTFTCHIMDFLSLVAAVVVAIGLKQENDSRGERHIVIFGNIVFVLISFVSLIKYVNYRESNFIQYFIIALMVYTISMVIYILRRIGLSAEEVRDYARTKDYAYQDELTKLGNRRKYWEIINRHVDKGVSENFTVVFMDVNRLKYVNDTMGHEAGDELLIGAAGCIQRAFKCEEIFRMGGDEFALIIVASEEELNKKLEIFRNEVSKWKGKLVKELSIAVGVAAVRENKDIPLDELCKIADDRMYADKKAYYDSSGVERRN